MYAISKLRQTFSAAPFVSHVSPFDLSAHLIRYFILLFFCLSCETIASTYEAFKSLIVWYETICLVDLTHKVSLINIFLVLANQIRTHSCKHLSTNPNCRLILQFHFIFSRFLLVCSDTMCNHRLYLES